MIQSMRSGPGGSEQPPAPLPPLAATMPAPVATLQNHSSFSFMSPVTITGRPVPRSRLKRAISAAVAESRSASWVRGELWMVTTQNSPPVTRSRSST